MSIGFDPDFLGTQVHIPSGPRGPLLDYMHYSVQMNIERKLAWWSAWNIDGLRFLPGIGRETGRFRPDPRLDKANQTTDKVYANNRLDRGHIARRADLIWGSIAEATQANDDSFYFTNITPQMDDFNQSSDGGVWGNLENAAMTFASAQRRRLSVFGGPIFGPRDIPYRDLVRIPIDFWKIITFVEADVLKARAFVLTQDIDVGAEVVTAAGAAPDVFAPFATFEVTIADVEARSGLTFPQLRAALGPAEPGEEAAGGPRRLADVADIAW
ncbi:DNA/RNA non-specific endonuclease [Gordonia sp. ABSL1-1]|uniref:DNA/RNA non-specific endonuclease n=1 Tax=Gordonia sp. ABSL1-1 TaxID=3053923 RepID=UPI0025735886|nr:DNA/RNA non-specific endonuclease [Gordonia sp. ABSL1-1]MDL9935956.1 DNA/RNA non-specific endonuclease [Gordonia sp. ABSL1-1]